VRDSAGTFKVKDDAAAVYRSGVWRVPQALRPGDKIRLVACSGPFDHTLLWRGAGWLAQRYRVCVNRALFRRDGYLAGSDNDRRAELEAALADPDARAIVAARGGYGAGRIARDVNWSLLETDPKWIVGFSDVTALHIEAQRRGVVSLHAANAAGLGRGDAANRERWIAALERPEQYVELPALASLRGGSATGPLVGGNLSLLASHGLATGVRPPPGAILFFEDVDEPPYSVDRMLTSLRAAGFFDTVSGVAVGEMLGCEPGRHGVPVENVLRERLADLGVPVIIGLPSGHGRNNVPLPLGCPARVVAEPSSAALVLSPQARR
jgi:muramoyltetrapeptide carboxypeptidase